MQRAEGSIRQPAEEKPAEGLRLALFSGNYNYTRDGCNQALNRLATLACVALETPILKQSIDAAWQAGGGAKISGAGGGDCAIALADRPATADAIQSAWAALGVEILTLAIAPPSPAVQN